MKKTIDEQLTALKLKLAEIEEAAEDGSKQEKLLAKIVKLEDKKKALEGSFVVCILETPMDDAASILCLNLTTLEQDKKPACQAYAKAIRTALGRKRDKSATIDELAETEIYNHGVDMPCIVYDCVTLFLE